MFLYNERGNLYASTRVKAQSLEPQFVVTNSRRLVTSPRPQQQRYCNDDEGLVRVTSSTNGGHTRPLGILRNTASKPIRPKTAPSPRADYKDSAKSSTRQRLAEYAKKHNLEICVAGFNNLTPRQRTEQDSKNSEDCVVLVKSDQGKNKQAKRGTVGSVPIKSAGSVHWEEDTHVPVFRLPSETKYRDKRCQSSRSTRTNNYNPTHEYVKRASSADPRWRGISKSQRINALATETSDLDAMSVVSSSTGESIHEHDTSHLQCDSRASVEKILLAPTPISTDYETTPRRANRAQSVFTRKNNPKAFVSLTGAGATQSRQSPRPVSALRYPRQNSQDNGRDRRQRPKSAPNGANTGKIFRGADNALNGNTPVGFESLKIDTRNNGSIYNLTCNNVNGTSVARRATQRQYIMLSEKMKTKHGKHVDFDEDQMLINVNVEYLRDTPKEYNGTCTTSADPIVTYAYASPHNRTVNCHTNSSVPLPYHHDSETPASPNSTPRYDASKRAKSASVSNLSPRRTKRPGETNTNGGVATVDNYYYQHWFESDPTMAKPPQKKPIVVPVHPITPSYAHEQSDDENENENDNEETEEFGCPPPPNSPDLIEQQ